MAAFEGKTVVVTGAAGGIGRDICRHFAAAGARIGGIDRKPDVHDALKGLGPTEFCGEVADIADAQGVTAAIARIAAALGPIDVLVNNAGFSDAMTLGQMTNETWRREIDGNLNGAWYCAAAVIPAMRAKGGGAIVTIGSVNGLVALGNPAYSAAKAGLINMTRAIALEYGKDGIRANIVCPGTVATPIWRERAERNPRVFETLVKWYPLKRIVETGDIAKAVLFLASDDAAAITGVTLPVDCGLMAGNPVLSSELTLEQF